MIVNGYEAQEKVSNKKKIIIIMQEAANKKIVYLGVLRIIIWEPHILVEAE